MKKKAKFKFLSIILTAMLIFTFQCSTIFAATVGDRLTQPQTGWQRIDDRDENIVYSGGNWGEPFTGNAFYLGTYHLLDKTATGNMSFKFYGTEFRIIGMKYKDGVDDALISVDGENTWENISFYKQNANAGALNRQIMIYEKTGLEEGIHSVVISKQSKGNMFIDAIDIDEDGYMIPYETVEEDTLNIKEEKVNINEGSDKALTLEVTGSNYTTSSAIWESSDESIATVDNNGVVTGLQTGTVTITVMIKEAELLDYCTVNVVEKTSGEISNGEENIPSDEDSDKN